MAKLKIDTEVNAPIETVFRKFSDVAKSKDHIPAIEHIEMLTDGPVGVGTRFKETRIMFGKEATEEMEITEFTNNKSFTIEADSCGSHFSTRFYFEPLGQSTRVNMEMDTRANTFAAKLMSPIGFLMMPSMKKMMRADIDCIKSACENEQ